MTRSSLIHSLSLTILLLSPLLCLPGWAGDLNGKQRDNSGRQIAVVVPGMPHPAPVTPVPAAVGRNAGRTASPADTGSDQDIFHSLTKAEITPVQVSPEMKSALDKGATVAQGLSKIAVKRAADFGTWVSVLWRQLNDVPNATPTPVATTPDIPVTRMQPINDPGKGSQLFYTNERRLKTVVGR